MKPTSHDQNFKNMIIDYPLLALKFFAPTVAAGFPPGTRITPIRQEQLKERLGDRFRELDIPLLVEFPNGERAAIIFVLEQDTKSGRFSLYRHAIYCLSVAEMMQTDRVIAVAIHLFSGGAKRHHLRLGTEQLSCLDFNCIICELPMLDANRFLNSGNLVERLCLPLMKHSKKSREDVYSAAMEGLVEQELDKDKQAKYFAFISGYAKLNPKEVDALQERHKGREDIMTLLSILEARGEARGETRGETRGKIEGRIEGKIEGKIEFALDLWRSGALTAAQARNHLRTLKSTEGDVSKKLVAEALKILKS